MQPSIVIADDHSMVRKGMKLLLQANMGYKLVHEASSCAELMAILQKTDCSHLILDIILSDGTALEVISNIKRLYPDVRVMIFSMQLAEVYADAFKQYDVHYFLHKSSSEEHTKTYLSKFLNGEAPTYEQTLSRKNPFAVLSPRELEVVHYLLNGYQTKDISRTLNLGMSTVSTLKKRIYEKTETDNFKQLLELASLYDINF